jgi:hypothetical protein
VTMSAQKPRVVAGVRDPGLGVWFSFTMPKLPTGAEKWELKNFVTTLIEPTPERETPRISAG